MTSTQRSEGMNNVFKKRFRRKLCLSELIEECEKCTASLRENELDADYKSRSTNPIIYMPHLAMLKTAAQSYTRNLYSDFEENLKSNFLSHANCFNLKGQPIPIRLHQPNIEAIIIFNSEDLTIKCSCRKYECIGMYHSLN